MVLAVGLALWALPALAEVINGHFEHDLQSGWATDGLDWDADGAVSLATSGFPAGAPPVRVMLLQEAPHGGLTRLYQEFDVDQGVQTLTFRYRMISVGRRPIHLPPDSFTVSLTGQEDLTPPFEQLLDPLSLFDPFPVVPNIFSSIAHFYLDSDAFSTDENGNPVLMADPIVADCQVGGGIDCVQIDYVADGQAEDGMTTVKIDVSALTATASGAIRTSSHRHNIPQPLGMTAGPRD
jgi:hypothetical protein